MKPIEGDSSETLYPTSDLPVKRATVMENKAHIANYREIIQRMKQEPLICTSIIQHDRNSILEDLSKAEKQGSDLAELRIDFLNEKSASEIKSIISESTLPLIITNRNKENGGFQYSNENQRLSLLESCLSSRPAFIDIELYADKKGRDELIAKAKGQKVGVIGSYHDFKGTPSEDKIVEIYRQIVQTGADLAKLVFTPNTKEDVLRILRATQKLKDEVPFALFGMGQVGQSSRIICPILGSCLTYCAIEPDPSSGLAQIPLASTRGFFDMTKRTKGWKSARESNADVMLLATIEFGTSAEFPFRPIEEALT